MSNSLLFKGPEELNQKLEPILDQMTKVGMLINEKELSRLSERLEKKIWSLEEEAYRTLGYNFNLNSPKQLAEILFGELKLPPGKKIKSGYSTDEQSLKRISSLHPLVPIILGYREIFKIKSTYVDSLSRLADKNHRVHSKFKSDVTSTGRLTSSDPNLQNIPIRGSWGKDLRKVFLASPGFVFLSADYSQFEFRILAHFSGDAKLIEAFQNNIDIHRATAAEIFNKKPQEVNEEERRIAKTVNFGVIYGISPHGLSEELNIPYEKADQFIHDYFVSYGGVRHFLEGLLREAEERGWVETLGGFRREIPELKSGNFAVRSAGQRMAVNLPFQGTAAEIIKVAMIEIDQYIKDKRLKTRMVLQIHDEILLEVALKELDEVSEMVCKKMETAVDLRVPLRVDLCKGKSWGELEEIGDQKQIRLTLNSEKS